MSMILKLDDVLNCQPITVHEHTPFQRVHSIFVKNGLRHLPVMDDYANVTGIITRQDLYDQTQGIAVEEDHEFIGQAHEEIEDLFAALDTDGDGVIDTDEWARAEEALGGGTRQGVKF